MKLTDTHVKTLELTPERKEKFARVSAEVMDFIKARTEGPLEAYAIMRLVCDGLEEVYGIRGNIFLSDDDHE